MNTSKEKKLSRESAVIPATHSDPEFDFDLWAVQVKQQMLAALRRRGVRW